jgi:hypothetical protein
MMPVDAQPALATGRVHVGRDRLFEMEAMDDLSRNLGVPGAGLVADGMNPEWTPDHCRLEQQKRAKEGSCKISKLDHENFPYISKA